MMQPSMFSPPPYSLVPILTPARLLHSLIPVPLLCSGACFRFFFLTYFYSNALVLHHMVPHVHVCKKGRGVKQHIHRHVK